MSCQETQIKKSRFRVSQIVSILKEAEAGAKVSDICRKQGISDARFYNWKSNYVGMEASDLERMKEMGSEFSQMKRLYADMALENRALKNLMEKSSSAVRKTRGGAISGDGASAVYRPQRSAQCCVTRTSRP